MSRIFADGVGATGAPPRPRARRARLRSVLWQAVALATVVGILTLVGVQTAHNLTQRGIASGFGYLGRAAGFELPPGPVAYSSRDTYARALQLGLVNTLRVSVLGIVIATVLGTAIGVAHLSRIRLVAAVARTYVELLRNTPLLLQLVFWYALSQALPDPRHALHPLPGIYLCIRGLFLPTLAWHPAHPWLGTMAIGTAALLPAALMIVPPLRSELGENVRGHWVRAALALTGLAMVVVVGTGVSVVPPTPGRFGFQGGLAVTPEFAALLAGLSTYTAAFIAEIVRGGIVGVSRGQTEAAASLGLSRRQALWHVVMPQARRVIIPPLTSQFVSLAKNSSLAVAIGYSDLMSVTDTTLNQTGQAVEAIAIAIGVYLLMNLVISSAMNWYNRRASRAAPWARSA